MVGPFLICVSILDLASGKRVDHRAGERILICSTFKALAAAGSAAADRHGLLQGPRIAADQRNAVIAEIDRVAAGM